MRASEQVVARIEVVAQRGKPAVYAWEVARELFPTVPLAQTFLIVSETIANLEVMEARGEVRRSLVDGVWRFG